MVEYHNTNDLRDEPLAQAESRAQKQSKWILEFFQRNPHTPLTPSAVKRAYDKAKDTDILITSVRRAMTNLSTNSGPLEKIEGMKTRSPRGGFEGYWTLRQQEGQQGLFCEQNTKVGEKYGGMQD